MSDGGETTPTKSKGKSKGTSKAKKGSAPRVDATERLMNLVALLTSSRGDLTLAQIVDKMTPQYSGTPEGIRTAFERDKKILRELGLPILTQTLGGEDAGRTAYSIDRSVYRTYDFGLTPEELSALQEAAVTVQIGTTWGRRAVQWLGGEIHEPAMPEGARVPAEDPVLPALWTAVSGNCTARFTYHGRERTVQPWGLLGRNGFWYLIAFDPARNDRVNFRVDRIEGDVVLGEPGGFVRPEDFSLESGVTRDAKAYPGGEDQYAVVRVHQSLASRVAREVGSDAVVATRSDGSVDVEVPCGNRIAFRSWLFAMVDRACVVSPESVRNEIMAELETIAGGTR